MALGFFVNNSNAQSYQKTDTGIKATIASLNVEIQFYSPSIVRIVKYPIGQSFRKQNLSVIATPQKTAFSVKQKGDVLHHAGSLNVYKKGKKSYGRKIASENAEIKKGLFQSAINLVDRNFACGKKFHLK